MNDSTPPDTAREVVLPAPGSWISGPGVDVEEIPAEHVAAGDRLLVDGLVVEVDDVRCGWYWFPEGHEPGVAIGWQAGTSSGVMFRRGRDPLRRVR